MASPHVVGEGVLCGAVSSNAHRWGALSRPNGGLFLRVPLREHLHLPAWICNCARVQRPHAGTILTRRHNALITTRQELTHTPPIGGAERRARKRASSWSARSRREDTSTPRLEVWAAAEAPFQISWEGGWGVLVGRVKRATKETRD